MGIVPESGCALGGMARTRQDSVRSVRRTDSVLE